jgi:hypothetical protein
MTGGEFAMLGYLGTFVGELTEQQYDIIDASNVFVFLYPLSFKAVAVPISKRALL